MEKPLNEEYVIRRIRQNKEINCVAIVVSSWHYLNALATIDYLMHRGKVQRSIVLVCPHNQAGLLLDSVLYESNLINNVEKVIFQYKSLPNWNEVVHYLKSKEAYEKEFYILRPVEPKIEFTANLWNKGIKRNYIHITIDEGLGYYLRDTAGWLKEKKVINNGISEKWNKIVGDAAKKYYSEIMLKKKGQLKVNTFFLKKGKKLDTNNLCVEYLGKIFKKVSKLYEYSNYDFYNNKLIICTQPFNDLGMVRNNADIKVIHDICDRAKERNIEVILKPHPRETNIEKYQSLCAYIDENNLVPLEAILAGLKSRPVGIIGVSTTTLVTAKVLWNIPTFSIIDVIGKKNFCNAVIEDINNFSKYFSDYVTNIHEIESIFQ